MVILQHVLDVIGMADEIRTAETESHGDDVAILARALKEKPQRILPSLWEHAHERKPGRPGWDLGGTASQAALHRHYLMLAVEPVPVIWRLPNDQPCSSCTAAGGAAT